MKTIKEILNLSIILFFLSADITAQNDIDSLKRLLPHADNNQKAYIYNELCECFLNTSSLDSVSYYADKASFISKTAKNRKELSISLNYKGYVHYYNNSYDSALFYFSEACDFSKEAGFMKGQADNLALISRIYFKKGLYDKSLEKLNESIVVDKKAGNIRGVAISYLDLGKLYKHTGKYKMSVDAYIKALKIFEELNEPSAVASINGNISYVYVDWKDYVNAMKYIKNAEKIFTEIDDKRNMANTYNSIGLIYNYRNINDSAFLYFNKALSIFTELKLDFDIAVTQRNMSVLYEENEDYDKALKSIQSSLVLFEKAGNLKEKTVSLFNIGRLYLLKKEYINSKKYFFEALNLADSIKDIKQVLKTYQFLSQVYAETGDYKKAYESHLSFFEINDSIFNETVHQQISELETKYETEKKEQEIKLLKKEAFIREIKLSKSKILWISFLIISILLVSIAFILIKRNIAKREINKILSEKNKQLKILNATKTKFFAIISHDLLNPVSAFHTLTNAIESSFNDIEKEQLYDFIKELNKSSEKTYLLLQNLLSWASVNNGRMKYNPENTDLYMLTKEVVDVLKINADEKNIIVNSAIPEKTVAYIDKLMISTVLRNLISNAVKFSPENSQIIIESEKKDDNIIITVKDTGKGLSDEDVKKLFKIEVDINDIGDNKEKGTGLGLILCKELTEKCGGKIWAKSELNIGSEFIFTVPTKNSKFVHG